MGEAFLIGTLIASTLASTATTLATRPKSKPVADIKNLPEPLAGDQGDATAARLAEQRRRQAGEVGRASTIMSGSPLGQPGQANTSSKYLTGA